MYVDGAGPRLLDLIKSNNNVTIAGDVQIPIYVCTCTYRYVCNVYIQWSLRITDTMRPYKFVLSTEVSLIRRLSKNTMNKCYLFTIDLHTI